MKWIKSVNIPNTQPNLLNLLPSFDASLLSSPPLRPFPAPPPPLRQNDAPMEVRASLRRALIIGAACAVPLHISTQRYIWRSTAQACDNMPNSITDVYLQNWWIFQQPSLVLAPCSRLDLGLGPKTKIEKEKSYLISFFFIFVWPWPRFLTRR